MMAKIQMGLIAYGAVSFVFLLFTHGHLTKNGHRYVLLAFVMRIFLAVTWPLIILFREDWVRGVVSAFGRLVGIPVHRLNWS